MSGFAILRTETADINDSTVHINDRFVILRPSILRDDYLENNAKESLCATPIYHLLGQ